MPQTQNWSTQQLAEFLDLITAAPDEPTVIRDAVDRVAEAIDAEIAAIVSAGQVEAAIGFASGTPVRSLLDGVVRGEEESMEIAGLGLCPAIAAPIEADPPAAFVLARYGDEFSREEVGLLRGMARALALTLGLHRGLEKERALRHLSELEAAEREQAETKYRTLVERLPAIVYRAEAGEDGAWQYVSPQIEGILGFTAEEWTSDPHLWAEHIHPDDRARVLAQEADLVVGEANEAIDYRMLTRDGGTVWVLDEAVLEPDDAGLPLLHGTLYDITARKEAEQEVQRRSAQGAAVARLGERALKGADPESLIAATVPMLAAVEGVRAASLLEHDYETDELIVRSDTEGAAEAGARIQRNGSGTPAGLALQLGSHIVVDDWLTENRFPPAVAAGLPEVRSSLSVVIGGKDRSFGVIEVHSGEPRRFRPQDVNFVLAAANVLGDAIERRKAEEAVRHRALHDPLTGLPNRLLFGDRVQQALGRGRRNRTGVSVLFLDLDHFKVVNDSLGHQSGDELLGEVAPRLREALRSGDTVARFGGDEFGVLLEDLESSRDAELAAERLAAALSRPFVIRGVERFISASVGIAIADHDLDDPTSLIRDADAAMYKAKAKGRARAERFDETMRAQAVERLEIEHDLRHAVEDGGLHVAYQPVVSIPDLQIVGVETLVRWNHPTRGPLPPDQFIPIAEETGLIEHVGQFVLGAACAQAVLWQSLRPDARPLSVSVNISARELARPGFTSMVARTLAQTGLDPELLTLEITESVLVEDSDVATNQLHLLGELGLRLALDDFGTGYSSLSYLNRFPLDVLKIDRSFVDGLGTIEERSALVEAIIGMGRALGLRVVAEGVETEAQLNELTRLGCELAQGFYFAKPLSDDEIAALVFEPLPIPAPSEPV